MNLSQIPEKYFRSCLSQITSPYVFLETSAPDKENNNSFLFNGFAEVITFNYGDDPDLFFKKGEKYLDKGYWLSGYFSYEFGYELEPALFSLRAKSKIPLAWLGVSKKPKLLKVENKAGKEKDDKNYKIGAIKPNISKKEYQGQIKKIKYYLEEGLSYQVNFTFKVKFDFKGSVPQLYLDLRRVQPTPYSALIDTGKESFLSFSPELFFRLNRNKIIARPMKGTIKRGLVQDEDDNARKDLGKSKKVKAENLMIVDLLRNDLGRIAECVRTSRLFDIEKHKTLYQMTSTIEAKPKENLTLKEIFCSLFPCGSVTGAPKIKTMEIIKKIEKESRGIYTGAIGYISPKRESCFNVAIRTVHLKGKSGELGVGGGIVYDSLAEDEYEEALLKAKFFIGGFWGVQLIESILWSREKGYYLLDLHIKRLKNSGKYFSIPLNCRKLKQALQKVVAQEKRKLKVRVLVSFDGSLCIDKKSLLSAPPLTKVKLSSKRIDSNNHFLYHKTNQRSLYDKERKKAKADGFFEVIFLNEQGQLTEGSMTNIFIKKGNQLYTPALKCGLLPGVLREHLLKTNKVKEKILYTEDILKADKIYIGNSVRGLIEVETCEGVKRLRKTKFLVE